MNTASIPVQSPATEARLQPVVRPAGPASAPRFSQILEVQSRPMSRRTIMPQQDKQLPEAKCKTRNLHLSTNRKTETGTEEVADSVLVQAALELTFYSRDSQQANTERHTDHSHPASLHLGQTAKPTPDTAGLNLVSQWDIHGADTPTSRQHTAAKRALPDSIQAGSETLSNRSAHSLSAPSRIAADATVRPSTHPNPTRGHAAGRQLSGNLTETVSREKTTLATSPTTVRPIPAQKPGSVATESTLAPHFAVEQVDTPGSSRTPDSLMNSNAVAMPTVLPLHTNPGNSLFPALITPLQHASWSADFTQHVIGVIRQSEDGTHTTTLRLNPPELGPIRLSLTINDTIAHAVFSSAHASVRQAIENALPQLASQLEQAGLSLGQADVGDQSQTGDQQPGTFAQATKTTRNTPEARSHEQSDPSHAGPIVRQTAIDSLIDTFA